MISGEGLRNEGMQMSLDYANKKLPGWSEIAHSFLIVYPFPSFMVEDLRAWAYESGCPRPDNEKAWGGVIVGARKQGLVAHKEYRQVKNPKAHCATATCWMKTNKEKAA